MGTEILNDTAGRSTQAKITSMLLKLAAIYILICIFMYCWQRHLLYFPEKDIHSPQDYGLNDFSDITLRTSDGLSLQAWYHQAQAGKPTLIYFHGNGGNLGNRANYFNVLAGRGFGILALSYRGYGKSEGMPTEQGLYTDARAAMDHVQKELHLPPEQIMIYGESLGTGIAVQMATEYKVSALVLQSPYTSMSDEAAHAYHWLPARYLVKDKFDSLSKIDNIHTKLLIIHGAEDAAVPVEFAKTLFAKAAEPKQAVYVQGAHHIDLPHEVMANALEGFLASYK